MYSCCRVRPSAFRGVGCVETSGLARLLDQGTLYRRQIAGGRRDPVVLRHDGSINLPRRLTRSWTRGHPQRKMLGGNDIALTQDYRTLEAVAQLPDVAGPAMLEQ